MDVRLSLDLPVHWNPYCWHPEAEMPRRARAWLPVGACLVGLIVTPARCSQAAAARTVLPPYAARAAQPPALPAAVNVWARSGVAYTERDDLRTLRTVIETSVQRADSA